ncbi:sensor histidine kinase [Marinobacter halotolerans]|uniref:sensor histidine kinase n=1 Tax=Marinobacter halotolerans TaxID=1569211 RepID=UPI001CDA2AAB|nr:sensor histidine kinase [Marinobacter halotolerans]
MFRHSLGIGTRLAIIIVCFSLTAIIAVAMTAYRALNQDFGAILAQQQAYEAQRVSTMVSQRLQTRLAILDAFSTTLTDGKNRLSTSRIEDFIGRKSALLELFSNGLVVLDEKATAIAESDFVEGRIGTNYADRAHFARALETRQPVISRPIIGRATGVPILSFVVPIESDADDLLGFLSGSINLNETNLIPSDALKLSQRQQAHLLVVDTDNFLYVESTDEESGIRSLPSPGENPLIDAALSGMGLGEVTGPDGNQLIYATSHLERLGWLFIRAVPEDQANAPATKSFRQFFKISLIIILVILPLGFMVTRSAMKPLDQMTQRIRNMSSSGASSSRLAVAGPPEVRNLALAFNQLQDERDATSQMQEDFLSNVSHELRTPLTSMNGALRLIVSGVVGKLPAKAEEMSKLALRNSERLQLLISDLLDFNKLAAGEMQATMATQPLAPIVTQAIEDNQATAREHRIALIGQCDRELMIHTDAHRLRQILDNFISNAIKFSPDHGEVRVEAQSAPDGMVRLTVSDHGSGFPEQFRERLFRRFAQAEAGTKKASKGTGLGLAICRELTLMLGGRIGAYNDRGAHFWVELPTTGARESAS